MNLKKLLAVACTLALLATALVSCGKKEINPDKYVKLGEYKGITVEMDTTVTDAEFNAALAEELKAYAENVEVDRAAALGDVVNIDYVGKMDGVAFEGGTDSGFDLTLGSNTFIGGFESGLVGAVKGEQRDLNISFPDPYPNNPDFAGKPAVFEVTVNGVYEVVVPELTLEFVQENTDYESVEDYKSALRISLEAEALELAKSNKYANVWQTVIDNATFIGEFPQDMYNEYKQEVTAYYEEYASYYGMSMEDLLSNFGMTLQDVEQEAVEYAEQMTKQELVLLAIIKAENITLSKAEYDAGVAGYLSQYTGYEDAAAFEEAYGRELIEESLLWDKTLEFVVGLAVEVPVA